jgi:hypothetical protein
VQAQIIPPDVIRLLSFHGPVEVRVGGETVRVSGRVEVAPFEDRVELFLPKRCPLEKALLGCCKTEVIARKEDGQYALRMEGRAHAGQAATRHPQRAALEPWKPEGRTLQEFYAAAFVPERLELIRNEAEDRVRYHGKTPAADVRPSARALWGVAAFGGRTLWMAMVAFVAPFGWLIYMGADYPGRTGAMFMALVTGLSLSGASRLWTIQMAYRRWREGRAQKVEASILADGFMAPDTAGKAAVWLCLVGVLGSTLLWSLWDAEIALIGTLANGAWLAGPASWMHLTARSPDSR